jgi:RNA chaperone Hfq
MKKSKKINAQEYFFDQIIKYKLWVNIFIKSGFKFEGHILEHDNYAILFQYKHHDIWKECLYMKIDIATILPFDPLVMDDLYASLDE